MPKIQTIVKGLRGAKILITPSCRKVNTVEGAIDLALKKIKESYLSMMKAKLNEDADFYVVITVDRRN